MARTFVIEPVRHFFSLATSTLSMIIFFGFIVLSASADQEVMGCGGFVRSNKNIDISRIQMVLYSNKNGNLRKVGSTDCAPINGYYFIPVSEHGDYVLKAIAPRGWKVTPSEQTLSIDGVTDACSKNSDLNFEFGGFGITGSILSQGSSTGPAGIVIDLLSTANAVLQSSTTNEDGHFDFFGVSPGSYVVRINAQHVKNYDFDAEKRTIEVGEDVGVCPPFKILGFHLTGSAMTPSGRPLKNVQITINGAGVDTPMVLRTDKDGQFRARLPNGKYSVRAEHDDKLVKILQDVKEVTIEHSSVTVDPFKVVSFSVRGQVTTRAGGNRPLASAKVEVTKNGQKSILTTSADGRFVIDQVSQPPLVIKVAADGYDFDAVTLSEVEPGVESGASIAPARYLVTGKVERDSLPADTEVRIKFSSASSDVPQPQNGRVIATDRGFYSIYLPSGKYIVSVELSVEQTNIGFAPLQHELTITDGPVRNINFQPIKASLEGRVACLVSDCSPGIEVSLVADGGSIVAPQKKITGPKGDFKFEGVLPGTYTLSIADRDRRCWQNVVQKISVSSDMNNILFTQTGFSVTVTSTRSAVLVVADEKSGNVLDEVVLVGGDNAICLKSQQSVRLSTKGCEVFEIEPSVIEDSASLDVDFKVKLRPTMFQVSGRITSKAAINDLKLVASSDKRRVEVETQKISSGYAFSFYAQPGEELTFQPQSEEHLFDPESLHVFVDNDCHLESVMFEANTGFFLRGQVSPAVEGVKVDLVDRVTRVVRQSVTTKPDGTYKVGPMPADATYDILAEKEGYIFEAAGSQGHFNAKKLASIVVSVVDGATGASLPGVVVSISGGVDYRSNTVTKKEGVANFLSLAPGRYFAKPQLKEYEFDPKHQILDLIEGQTGEVTFKGKRVAFSIFGKIASLNGEPEAGVNLKAKGIHPEACVGHSEEATSEASGDFRFRGLQPHCEYAIKLQHQATADKQTIEKLMPDETKVLVGTADTHLPSALIAMRSFEFTDAIVKIVEDDATAGKKPPLVKLSVTSDYGFSFSFTALVGQPITLPRLVKDDKRYTITAETISSEKFTVPKRAVTYFRADEYFKYLEVTISKQVSTTSRVDRKISSFVFILPIIIVALASYIFWDKLPASVQNAGEKIFASAAFGGSSAVGGGAAGASGAEEDWDGSSAAKKRAKKRA